MALNVRVHMPGNTNTTLAQLAYLRHALEDGAADRMQEWFPEGYVFTWALYGAASAQAAAGLPERDPRRPQLLAGAALAVSRVRSTTARSTFTEYLDPPFGAFYASWSLYVTAQYVRAAGVGQVDPALFDAFRRGCAEFADALSQYSSPFLPSYPYAAWPADTAVGVGALGVCRDLVSDEYDSVVQDWVQAVTPLLDQELEALSHAANWRRGTPMQGVRGSSLALMSRVLVDASPEFARTQYQVLRDHFVTFSFGVPGIREYPRGTSGHGDVDSGPLIFGISGPAVVVGGAAARAHGDEALARVMLGAVEMAGLPLEWQGRRFYAGGVVPVGDAFIAWARSTAPADAGKREWAPVLPNWWAVPFHLVSALFVAGLVWLGMRGRRPSKRSDT